MLLAKNITFAINGKRLLDEVSLYVEAGEVVVLVGANGAGKSTIVRALSSELKLQTGCINLDGKPLASYTNHELAARRAVLPQSSTLAFPFNVLQVVLLGRTPHIRGREIEKDYDIARHALEATDALHLAARSFPTLSGGERQRVQLARVLTQIWEVENKSRFLILDEPTSNLDLAHQQQTLMLARRFAREKNVGVLAVLHDLNLAAQFADRIVFLRGGRVITEGKPQDVLTSQTINDAYNIAVHVMPHPQTSRPMIVTLES